MHFPGFTESSNWVFSLGSISEISSWLDFDGVAGYKILEVYVTKILEYFTLFMDTESGIRMHGVEASHIFLY